jgi:pyridoxine 5'-phosphate synthase PdxJ
MLFDVHGARDNPIIRPELVETAFGKKAVPNVRDQATIHSRSDPPHKQRKRVWKVVKAGMPQYNINSPATNNLREDNIKKILESISPILQQSGFRRGRTWKKSPNV